jgi:hypothetical protein
MKATTIAAWLFWLPAAAFLGFFELYTDDAGVEALCILLIALVLGCLHPRRAWQWALLVGPCVPAADLLFGTPGRSPHGADLLLVTGFVVLLGLAGSYTGVLVRRFAAGCRDS